MPELPASGVVFRVNDYYGRGGVHWKPPFETLELRGSGSARACLVKKPGATCRCTLEPTASGKFSGAYDIGGQRGDFELEATADGALQLEFLNQSFSSYGNSRPGGVIVQARKGPPSLLDKKRFLPAILDNDDFRRKGVLFGEEPTIARDCKWVVIDPNRHKLRVWEKAFPTSDFVVAGQSLGASVFTNGPMVHARSDGNKYALGAEYVGKAVSHSLGNRIFMAFAGRKAMVMDDRLTIRPVRQSDVDKVLNAHWNKAADDVFQGPPFGNIVSFSNQIQVTAPQMGMTLGYFGRGEGTDFDSYKIGVGDPLGLAEASGGLYEPAILNYKVTPDTHGSNQWFYWGLAPLKAEAADETVLKTALAGYAAAGGPKPVSGLIIGMFYHGGNGGVVQHLADVGVRDAVKLDGSDSVMLGHDSTLEWGDAMTAYKRVWMRWGFAFYPQ